MAERVGFEPTVHLRTRLISSQVHSTTLPPLRELTFELTGILSSRQVVETVGKQEFKRQSGYSSNALLKQPYKCLGWVLNGEGARGLRRPIKCVRYGQVKVINYCFICFS
jgi:hypothetical protein